MTKLLVLGAGGQIARWVIDSLAGNEPLQLTLLLRDAAKLKGRLPSNARLVQGDVLNRDTLASIIGGQDTVYCNLAGGGLDVQAAAVVLAMQGAGVQRLIFVSSLGIYDEVPGEFGKWNRREIGADLPPYRRAADIIEASNLDYTILRPAWLTDADEVAYEITERREPFKGTEVSRKSVADLITRIVRDPRLHSRGNIGIDKPGSDGDRPSFY